VNTTKQLAGSGPLANEPSSLRSVHTEGLTSIFSELGISLAITTYQAGKVILVRKDGDQLNTHFRSFGKPMGLAVQNNRLSIGGVNAVWDYRNMPAVAPKLEPPGKHDACFMPRGIHVTGDIDIHEMAFDQHGELWLVNTRFGCLCTLDADHSFHPRWRPPFVSAYAAEDRCHLNGLAMRDGVPRYVTALGETDHAGGWRAHKKAGGLLMDVTTNKTLLHGLSMPHSPRWYQDKLWVLESGRGTLAVCDPRQGTWQTVAELPGFTRGLSFLGPLAFIGLSQVRESAIFSGIPLVDRVEQRQCGVWVVHIQSGQTLGFIRFESGVQEIFAVEVLRNTRYPELMDFNDSRLSLSYVLPDAALKEVHTPTEEELRNRADWHFQQGNARHAKGDVEGAVAAYRECIKRDPYFPNGRYNLGVALGDAEQFAEAEDQLLQVAHAEPKRAEVFNSLGHVAARQRDPQKAIGHYRQAVALQPDYATAHFNLGMTLLQTGDFENGFAECEWRWRTPTFTPFQCPQPLWDGSDLGDRTLLVHTEQGGGDAIQFARYLALARQRCGKLILVCPDDQATLFSSLDGVSEVRAPGAINTSDFDCYLPIMSFPHVFGTRPDTIPADIPYLDIEALRRRRGAPAPPDAAQAESSAARLRVGIVWAGSPTHSNDRHRSCRLNDLLPMLRTPGVQFFSLQKGDRRQEMAQLPEDIRVLDFGPPEDGDFTDLALAIAQMDLVISVDTSAAHLAGALGAPVWTLLCHVPDWRWGLDEESSPWYPSMRLFRQAASGDWEGVAKHVARALADQRVS